MANKVSKVKYCYVTTSSRAGQGAQVLEVLADADIDLLAVTGFPTKGGKAQIDLIGDDMAAIRRVARENGWRLSKIKKAFLIQGDDRVGAVYRQLQKLADKRINVTATNAVCAGKGRYGMLLWVKPKDYARASKALGAR